MAQPGRAGLLKPYYLRGSALTATARAGVSQRSGGVAQFVVDSEDVAVKAGYLKKCALTGGTFCRCANFEPL